MTYNPWYYHIISLFPYTPSVCVFEVYNFFRWCESLYPHGRRVHAFHYVNFRCITNTGPYFTSSNIWSTLCDVISNPPFDAFADVASFQFSELLYPTGQLVHALSQVRYTCPTTIQVILHPSSSRSRLCEILNALIENTSDPLHIIKDTLLHKVAAPST